MKRTAVVMVALLFGLISINLYAAEKDDASCKDHPLIPRMTGYYIMGCSNDDAVADIDIEKGADTETIHLEGKSMVLLYSPQPELGSKPAEAKLRSDFEGAVKKQGGSQIGVTYGQRWPVYKIAKDGKEYSVILMINSGEYFTGSYAYRIIEK